jgi:N-acetylneuraminic acid mutarotase
METGWMQNKNLFILQLLHIPLATVFLLFTNNIHAQSWSKIVKQNAPIATSNNAVCATPYNGIFTFGGIDTSKLYTGIHNKVFAFNIGNNSWTTKLDVPDTLGKLGVAASYLKNKIYLIGGYYVLPDGTEKSSNMVHVFDVNSNNWNINAAPLPIPIDDHVQCVWRDSLIYTITGWSNTSNVNNVQIFNPTTNTWQAGDAVPNNNIYKAFGASGTIVGDTIYYFGGASNATNFPATNILRKGVINATDPTKITWSYITLPQLYGYRMACTKAGDYVCWIGGSNITYNYNGIAYASGQGVKNLNRAIFYNYKTGTVIIDSSNIYNMDYRGIGETSDGSKYLIGGMQANQKVSDSCFKLDFNFANNIAEIENQIHLKLYPNPTKGYVYIDCNTTINSVDIINQAGETVLNFKNNCNKINVASLTTNAYFVRIKIGTATVLKSFIKN